MAIDFDNSVSARYVSMGDPTELRDVDPLTITCWIKPVNWGTLSFGRIVTKENSTLWGWLFFLNDSTGNETIEFGRYRNTIDANARAVDYSINLNVWQHVAVTYQSSSTALFANGVQLSNSVYSAGSGGIRTDSFDNFVVGNRAETGRGYNGDIDDIRIYERYLSAGEIGHIANSQGHDGIIQSLIGRWTFQQGAPGVSVGTGAGNVTDISVSRNNGTANHSAVVWKGGVTSFRRRT